MTTFEFIRQKIEEHQDLLDMKSSISITEAEKRASKFLAVLADLAHVKHSFTNDRIKLLSVQSAVYSQELMKCSGKTITENKISVEASSIYTEAREQLETIDNNISYLKAMTEIFLNGHLFYRQLSKEAKNG